MKKSWQYQPLEHGTTRKEKCESESHLLVEATEHGGKEMATEKKNLSQF